jgi:hypothetical protein
MTERPVALPPAQSGSANLLPPVGIIRLSNTTKGLEERHLEDARAAIKQARHMLADDACPDTFFGRKTQEPFPDEDNS